MATQFATMAGRLNRPLLGIPRWAFVVALVIALAFGVGLAIRSIVASNIGATPSVAAPAAQAETGTSNPLAVSKKLSALQIVLVDKGTVPRALSSGETVILIDDTIRVVGGNDLPHGTVLAIKRLNTSIQFGKGILEGGKDFADKERQVVIDQGAFATYDRFYQNLQLEKKGYLRVEATPIIDESLVRGFLARNTDPHNEFVVVDSEQRIPFHVTMNDRGTLVYQGEVTLKFRYQKQNPRFTAGADGNYIIFKELTH